MGTRFGPLLLAVAMLVGCSKQPMWTAVDAVDPYEGQAALLPRPTEGGPLVQVGRVEVDAFQSPTIRANDHEELFVILESGDFAKLFGWTPGAVARVDGELTPLAATRSSLIVAVVREAGDRSRDDDSPVRNDGPSWGRVVARDDVPVLSVDGGRLRVQIFHDAQSGARFGALSRLDADADLDVQEHTHDAAEALFIESGDGTMILGDQWFPIAPGKVIYIAPGVRHGYLHGTQPLRAWQIYAPPGPEQRFRELAGKTG